MLGTIVLGRLGLGVWVLGVVEGESGEGTGRPHH